jgi:hypothetical protein
MHLTGRLPRQRERLSPRFGKLVLVRDALNVPHSYVSPLSSPSNCRQSSPVTALDGINLNIRSFPDGKERLDIVLEKGEFAMGGFMTAEPGNSSSANYQTAWFSELLSTQAGKPHDYNGDPLIDGTYPIFADFTDDRKVVAMMNFQFSWQTYFKGILPDNANGFVMVLEASGRDSAKTCIGTHLDVTTAHISLLRYRPAECL